MKLDSLMTKIALGAAPCVLGLDMGYSSLPLEFMRGYADKAEAVRAFNRVLIGTVCDIIPAISVNVAALLPYGTETVLDAISYAKEKGLFTIADAKCSGDPVAAASEAELYFDIFDADCVTVSPYFGTDGLAPIFEKSREMEKSVFVVAHSEYGSPREVRELIAGTRSVYRVVCEKVSHLGDDRVGDMGYSEIGLSVGGVKNTVLSELRRTYKKTPMLITGYDGEKTAARDINGAFDIRGLGGLVYVTRAITEPCGDDAYSEKVRRAAEETVRELKLCF